MVWGYTPLVQPADADAFGKAIKEIRQAMGLRQKQVVDRVLNHYSNEGTYARVEQGRRRPDRDAAVAILLQGLSLTDISKINETLALAGYERLTPAEAAGLELADKQDPGLTRIHSVTRHPGTPGDAWFFFGNRFRYLAIAVATVFIAAALTLVFRLDIFMTMLTTAFYATLYAVSLLLENAYSPDQSRMAPLTAIVFGLMLVSSVGALAVDHSLATAGQSIALPAALAIFVVAAAGQWFIARSVLPDVPLVAANFQTQTAQVAHLKNTSYFLLIVFLFWLPPVHTVTTLRRQIELGQEHWVQSLLTRPLLAGRTVVCLNAGPLWLCLLAMLVATVPMGARLLDNLRSDPKSSDSKLNTYTALLYLRGGIYFILSIVCLGWYTLSLATLFP